jgi:hypothetical protein
MTFPGFSAEYSITNYAGFFHASGLDGNRTLTHTVTAASQCCPPGYNTTGCIPTPPPPPRSCCPPSAPHCCGSCTSRGCVGECINPLRGEVCP